MQAEIFTLGGLEYHRMILNAMPCPVFVVEEDVRIVDFNNAAGKLLNEKRELVLRRRAGEMLHCLHSIEVPEGCGHAPACDLCPIRNSVNDALGGQTPLRKTVKLELLAQDQVVEALFLISVAPMAIENLHLAVIILEDIREIEMLRQMLPICSNCKQIRNDDNYWQTVESYLDAYLSIDCTHGLCPDCAKSLFPEYADALKESQLQKPVSLPTPPPREAAP